MSDFKHTFADDIQEGVHLEGISHQVWRPSVAEPFYVGFGLRKAKCGCGQIFKSRQAFIEHYIYWAVWQNESGYIPRLLAKNNPDAKAVVNIAIAEFEKLCKQVRTDPNLGNSSKGKKDNFLDGAEVMLTAIQYAIQPKK